MAIYHCSIKIISRSTGRSAVAAASYRSGSRLYEAETRTTHDYTRKREIVHSEIDLPPNAPGEYLNRETLWNEVHKTEKNKNAQLAREVEVALPVEFSRERQIEVTQEYVKINFVDAGMCADWSIHDKGTGNPHAHILLTTRGIDENGKWMAKEKKTYALDENGDRIPLIDKKTGEQKTGKRNEKLWKRVTVQANDWNDKTKVEEWRKSWADICNQYLEPEKQIDHRSYKRQRLEKEPTIHEGYKAREMERDGIVSVRCEYNRTVRALNAARSKWRELTAELQQSILEKGRDLLGRIDERVRGHDEHSAEPREAAFHHRGAADGDREVETAERGASEIARQVKEKGDDINGRIEQLLQRRTDVAGAPSGRGITGRERTTPGNERRSRIENRETDTEAFIRDARADVANLLDEISISQDKANAARERRRNRESQREDRDIQRERYYLEQELRSARARKRSHEMER